MCIGRDITDFITKNKLEDAEIRVSNNEIEAIVNLDKTNGISYIKYKLIGGTESGYVIKHSELYKYINESGNVKIGIKITKLTTKEALVLREKYSDKNKV